MYFVGDRMLLQKDTRRQLREWAILFEDYPGLGKTLLAKAFAKATGCEFSRVERGKEH